MPVLVRPEPGRTGDCLKWAVANVASNKAEAVQVAVEELRQRSAARRNDLVPTFLNVELACAMLELMSRPDLNKMGMVLMRRTLAHGEKEEKLCLTACQRIANSQVSQLFIDSTLERMCKYGSYVLRWVEDSELFQAVFEKILAGKPVEYRTFASMAGHKRWAVFQVLQKARPLTVPERVIAARCSIYQYLQSVDDWYACANSCTENASSGKWLTFFKNMWKSKTVGDTPASRLEALEQVLVSHQESIQTVAQHYYPGIDKDTWLAISRSGTVWDAPLEIVFGSDKETVAASFNWAIALWFDTYTSPSSEKLEQLWETYPELYDKIYK